MFFFYWNRKIFFYFPHYVVFFKKIESFCKYSFIHHIQGIQGVTREQKEPYFADQIGWIAVWLIWAGPPVLNSSVVPCSLQAQVQMFLGSTQTLVELLMQAFPVSGIHSLSFHLFCLLCPYLVCVPYGPDTRDSSPGSPQSPTVQSVLFFCSLSLEHGFLSLLGFLLTPERAAPMSLPCRVHRASRSPRILSRGSPG